MSAELVRAVAGLGNPGPGHARTRHNAGFWLADALANKHSGEFRPEKKFSGELATLKIGHATLLVLKPMTYMNRSGLAVQALVSYYELEPSQVLVVHDDLDLPPGTARLKLGGGHGGHNGLRDVHAHIGHYFRRLRIGIGHPGHKDEVLDYVLHKPRESEETLIHEAIAAGVEAVDTLLAQGWDKAVHQLHSRDNGITSVIPDKPAQRRDP
jgi:peptidyl-tRNA hydrolase, PTH1 family